MAHSSRAFVTVITRSYLPYARVLARSLRQFHDEPLYVVCVDEPEGYFDPEKESFSVLTARDLVPAEDRHILFYYSAFEACTALRAYAHRYLLANTAHDSWVYLDSDILVTSPLDSAFEGIDAPCTGLVSPHCIEPVSANQLASYEALLLKFGVFNGGFLALRRSPDTHQFVEWFVERLRTLCFFLYRDVFVDQLWLNFIPLQFPTFAIWRNPGANVAYWNLHERVIAEDNGMLRANDEPLLFLHFSRWQQNAPEAWTRGRNPARGTSPDLLRKLGQQYRDYLDAAEYSIASSWPYGYSTFANGRHITSGMRRAYYERLVAGTAEEGNPFEHPEWFSVRFELNEWAAAAKRKLRRTLFESE